MSQGMTLSRTPLGDRAAFRVSQIVWIAVFAAVVYAFPRSGEGLGSTITWADQSLFLQTLNETIATGTSSQFSLGYVGPGYIALARLIHAVSGAPAASLVLLSLFSFFVTGVVLVAFVFRLTRQFSPAVQNVLMAVTVAVPFTSVWAYAADLPWTQVVETALLALLVLLIATPAKRWFTYAAIGFVLVLAYQTRPYEGEVTLIALGLVGIAWLISHRSAATAAGLGRAAFPTAMVVLGAALADALIFSQTQVAWPISQYGDLNSTFKIFPSLLPYKFMQLFVDTCFATICDRTRTVPTNIFAFGWPAWRQPLSLQHPALVGAAVAIVVAVVGSAAARRALFRPLVLFPLLVAGGAIAAYTAGVPSGSPHLRYGFMRDYLAPMVLLFMAMCALLCAPPVTEDAATIPRARQRSWSALGVFVVVVISLIGARPFAGNFLPGYAIADFTYVAQCTGDACRFSSRAVNENGASMAVPDATVFIKQCGGQEIAGVTTLGAVTYDPRACDALVLLPAVAGLFQTPGPADQINGPGVGAGASAMPRSRIIF